VRGGAARTGEPVREIAAEYGGVGRPPLEGVEADVEVIEDPEQSGVAVARAQDQIQHRDEDPCHDSSGAGSEQAEPVSLQDRADRHGDCPDHKSPWLDGDLDHGDEVVQIGRIRAGWPERRGYEHIEDGGVDEYNRRVSGVLAGDVFAAVTSVLCPVRSAGLGSRLAGLSCCSCQRGIGRW
jgi:hypothetical protein